jgi:pumilio RNA-binding family
MNDIMLYDQIFNHTLPFFWELMNDGFGNYLVQKLAEESTDEQLVKIIEQMGVEPVQLCKDPHGTRSVQKIIEVVGQDIHYKLISDYLKVRIKEMSEDINGNHVIQKILQCWSSEHNQFLYDAMERQCVEIACHKHGCCIMQKCIDAASQPQKKSLTQCIAKNTLVFVKNPFGNYVVQFVLKLKNQQVNLIVSKELMSNIISLSKQKFSSNVIEKCLEHNTKEVNKQLVACIMSDRSHYFDLLSDQFGNYVLQKSLSVAQEPQLSQFLAALQPEVLKLQTHSDFGYKIYQRLVKKYPGLDPTYKDIPDSKGRPSHQTNRRTNNGGGGQNKNQRSNQTIKQTSHPSSSNHTIRQGTGPQRQDNHDDQQFSKTGAKQY